MRTIVFHPYSIGCEDVLTTYKETKKHIENLQLDIVRTTQMCFLNTQLFKYNFNFILIMEPTQTIYISIDDAGNIYCPNTTTQLTLSHNLYKMWCSGKFH